MIFHDPQQFSQAVVETAKENNVGFMEAILIVCELCNIDPSAVGELITPPLKTAIEKEATRLHFFKNKTSKSSNPDTESYSLTFE